jgi:hypothetical protein
VVGPEEKLFVPSRQTLNVEKEFRAGIVCFSDRPKVL